MQTSYLLISQGISVAILYCFVSKDVRDAIRREYRRYTARRNANSIRRSNTRSRKSRNAAAGQPLTSIPFRIHFRTRIRTNRDETSASPPIGSQSLETTNTDMRNEHSSPPSPYLANSYCRPENSSNKNHNDHQQHFASTALRTDTTTATIEAAVSEEDTQDVVTMPIKELE